jgi:hypothetical protein
VVYARLLLLSVAFGAARAAGAAHKAGNPNADLGLSLVALVAIAGFGAVCYLEGMKEAAK